MYSIELDHENRKYRRQFSSNGSGDGAAIIFLDSEAGYTRDYVDDTLQFYVDRAIRRGLEHAAGTHVVGSERVSIVLELGYPNPSVLEGLLEEIDEDKVFKDRGVRGNTYLLSGSSLHRPGLPWTDSVRQAYALVQMHPRFGQEALTQQLTQGVDMGSGGLNVHQIHGSARFNHLVIMAQGGGSFDEDEGSSVMGAGSLVLPQQATITALNRIKEMAGVEALESLVCTSFINFFTYEAMMQRAR